MSIKLVIPNMEYENQVMEYRRIFLENDEPFDGCSDLNECNTYEEWIDFENRLRVSYKDSYVPSIQYLGIREEDNKLIGMINIRLELNDFLYNFGGNIGYSVLLSERRKGYAKEMLRLLKDECKKLGLDKVLLCCDKENLGSSKTIMSKGGILENEVEDKVGLTASGVIQRYWIDLK